MGTYIKREIEKEIKEYLKQFSAVALTGPRQSGKTTTLKKLFKKNFSYFSLDNIADRRIAQEDPALFIKNAGKNAIIDEIQYAPELLSYIKIEIDNNPRKKGRYILTGSQNFLMMKNFSESLVGRMGILYMPLLSVQEMKPLISSNKTSDFFQRACLSGTYPEPNLGIKSISKWYESYLQLYIERDVRTLFNIGNLRDFDKFLRLLAGRPGQILNMSSFASDIGVSVPTIKSWLSILEGSGIIYILYPYYENIRTRLVKSPKIYFCDIGLVCHLNNITDTKILYRHHLLGQIFENFCIMEAVKLFRARGKMEIFTFFKADKGVEVDLLIEYNGKIIPFEFKASMSPELRWATGIESLIAGKIKRKVLPGIVVNLRDEKILLSKNVKATGIFGIIDELKNI